MSDLDGSIMSRSRDNAKSKNHSGMPSNNQSGIHHSRAQAAITNKILEIFRPKGSTQTTNAHGSQQQSIQEVPESDGIKTESSSRGKIEVDEVKDEYVAHLEEWLSDGELCNVS